MSQVDDRVVKMQFDNKQFESGAKETISTLDKLKKALHLEGAGKGFDKVAQAADTVQKSGLPGISAAIEQINQKFSVMGVIAFNVISNITNRVISMGEQIARSITIDPIMDGLREYETQINSVQTILANTRNEGTNIGQVNAALDQLNTYADKTIYNFSEMTRNIGTFTAAGVSLDKSVSSIQGIANLAAVSGSSSQQASVAMYQLSQALASGTVKLMDWNSVVNAGMGGKVFQDALLRTSEHLKTGGREAVKASGSFRNSLEKGWLTVDVLEKTLSQFALSVDTAEEYNAAIAKLVAEGYTEKEARDIADMAKTAGEAATKVKTFSQLIDTLKEALGSGWAQTWRTIIGDFEQAKELWTSISDVLNDAINKSSDARNKVVSGWAENGGRQAVLDGLKAGYETLAAILKEVSIGFKQVIPPQTSENLINLSKQFQKFMENLRKGIDNTGEMASYLKMFRNVARATASVIKFLADLVINVVYAFGNLGAAFIKSFSGPIQIAGLVITRFGEILSVAVSFIGRAGEAIGSAFNSVFTPMTARQIGDIAEKINELSDRFKKALTDMRDSGHVFSDLRRIMRGVFSVFKMVGEALMPIAKLIFGIGKEGVEPTTNAFVFLLDILAEVGDFFTKLAEKAQPMFDILNEGVDKITGRIHDFTGGLEGIKNTAKFVWEKLKEFGGYLKEKLAPIFGGIFDSLKDKAGHITLDGIFKALLSGGLLVAIKKFVDLITATSKGVKDFFEGLEEGKKKANTLGQIFEVLKDGLSELKRAINVATLVAIAASLAILASAVQKLSDIEPVKLSASMVAISGLMATLAIGFKSLSKSMKELNGTNVVGSAVAMVLIAEAINILAKAMQRIADLSWEGISKGLTSVTVLMFGLNQFFKSFDPKVTLSGSVAMLALATSVRILAGALKKLGEMSWEELGRGLVGFAGSLVGVSLAFRAISSSKGLATARDSVMILSLAVAAKVLASALKEFGSMDLESIGRGLIGMGGALGILSGALIAISMNSDKQSLKAVVMVGALTLSIKSLAKSLKVIGDMDWESIARGLTGMAGTMIILGLAINAMPKANAMQSALAIVFMSMALNDVAKSLASIGQLSWEGIAKGLVSIAGSLALLVGAAVILNKTGGDAGLGFLSLGLVAIAGAIKMLSSIPIEGVGVALLALAGTFAILGVAGIALGPMLPVLIGLSGTLAVFAVSLSLVAGSIALLSIGLAALAASGMAGVVAIREALKSIIGLIPDLLQTIAASYEELLGAFKTIFKATLEAITGSAEEIAKFATSMIRIFCEAIIDNVPEIVDALVVLIQEALRGVRETFPDFVETIMEIITEVLHGVRDNIRDIAGTGVEIIAEFIRGVADGIGDVIDSLFELVISTLNGLADAIRNRFPEVCEALWNVFTAILEAAWKVLLDIAAQILEWGSFIIEKLAEGMGAGTQWVLDQIQGTLGEIGGNIKSSWDSFVSNGIELMAKLGEGILDGSTWVYNGIQSVLGQIGGWFQEKWNDFTSWGSSIVEGIASGISNSVGRVINAARDMGGRVADAIKGFFKINSPSKLTREYGKYIDEGLAVGILTYAHKASNAGKKMSSMTADAVNSHLQHLDLNGNFNPTIRPVLDLSDVDAGMQGLQGRSLDLSGSLSAVDGVTASFSQNGSSDSKSVSENGTVVNFTQNNYSPKALSQIEIYRNTRNQLSQMRGELQK